LANEFAEDSMAPGLRSCFLKAVGVMIGSL
jgi:hypothetical protein